MLHITTTNLSLRERPSWLSCSPIEYESLWRRKVAEEDARLFNQSTGTSSAFVDADGDLMFDERQQPGRHAMALANKRFRTSIQERSDALKELLGERHPRLLRVPVDVLPSSYFDVGAGPVPAGGDVVLISAWSGWFALWFEWVHCFILVDPSPFKSTEEWQANAEVTWQLARAVMGVAPDRTEIITKCIHVLDERLGRDFLESGKGMWHAAVFFQTFALFHEFGHIALGHTDAIRSWEDEDSLSAEQLASRRSLQRQYEFEADRFTVDVLAGFGSTDGTPEGAAFRNEGFLRSALLFFLLVDIANLGATPGNSPTALLATHPPAMERLRRIAGSFGVPESEDYVRFVEIWLGSLEQ